MRGGGGEPCSHSLAHVLNGPEFFTLRRSEPCPAKRRTLPPYPRAGAVLTRGSRIGCHSNSKVNKTAANEVSLGEGERHLEAWQRGCSRRSSMGESEGLSEPSRWDLERDPQVQDDNVW